MLHAGQEIDRYVVEAELGRGGMAVVYRVRHTRLNSEHALKVLSLSSKGLKERLLQEGQVQATLRHPNVVAVTDVLEVEGQPALVMEYVEGPTLEDWLREQHPTVEQAERLFRGILAAVETAHARDIVHRDLKPANVLLHPLSGDWIPKVTDFGLAKALAEEHRGFGATRSGIAMGTPRYMAPEQIRDAGSVDARADLFSLGCVLYELVTGRPPFDGPDVLSVFNRVASGSYVPPRSLQPDVPPHLVTAIQGCIVVDRERRIPDCATLHAVLDGADWQAPPVPEGGTVSRPPGELDSAETWAGDLPDVHGGVGRRPPSAPTVELPPAGGTLAPPDSLPGASAPPPSVSPAPAATSSPSLAPTRVRWLAAGGGLAVVLGLAGVGAAGLVGGLGWYGANHLAAAHARGAIADVTEGRGQIDDVRVGLWQTTARGIRITDAAGREIVAVDRVRIEGRGLLGVIGLAGPRRIGLRGLDIDLRRGDDGWVRPEGLAGRLSQVVGDSAVDLREVRLRARDRDGSLQADLDVITIEAAPADGAPRAWTAEGLEVAVHLPILEVARISGTGGSARVEGLDLWMHTRRDGWLDLPPMVRDLVPTYLGGSAEGAAWLGSTSDIVPIRLDTVAVDSGAVHLVDTAHAVHDVEWAVHVDQARASREGDGPWRVTALGQVDGGRVSLDGGLDPDGAFEARLDVRDLPVLRLHPYLGPALAEEGVALEDGRMRAVIAVEEEGPALGWSAAVELEDLAVAALDPQARPTWRERRLIGTRERVPVEADGLGSLDDPRFQPVEDLVAALRDAVLAPVPRAARRRAPAPADEAGPVLTPSSPPAESPAPAPPDTAPAPEGDEEIPEDLRERWRRQRQEAREALERLRKDLPF